MAICELWWPLMASIFRKNYVFIHKMHEISFKSTKMKRFYIFSTFNRHSTCIAPCFAMLLSLIMLKSFIIAPCFVIFQCIFIICLNHSQWLPYPKSRDAIASKNNKVFLFTIWHWEHKNKQVVFCSTATTAASAITIDPPIVNLSNYSRKFHQSLYSENNLIQTQPVLEFEMLECKKRKNYLTLCRSMRWNWSLVLCTRKYSWEDQF